jgi:GNAT superfamily N-acetyltransferase
MKDVSALVIRPLQKQDEDHWRMLWKDYLAFYKTELPEAIYQSSFARMLEGNAGMPGEFHGHLAVLSGRPVGLAHFVFHRTGWKIENVCYLQDLYAVPDVRGTGVGRALIESVYAAADQQGAPAVYWLTQDFNTQARVLYDRIGKLTPFIRYNRS